MSDNKDFKIENQKSHEIHLALKSIRKKRVLGLSGIVIMIFLVVGVLVTIEILALRMPPIIVLPLVFLGSGLGAFCMSPKCPKCNKPFYGFPLRFFWASSCMNCKTDYKENL